MRSKFWALLFGVVILAEFLLFAIAPAMNWWLPKGVSTVSSGVDLLIYVILAVTGIAFVGTEAVLVYNMYVATNRKPNEKAPYVHGNHKLELIWTAVPAVLLLALAIVQINVWADIKYPRSMKPEKDTLQIEVTARQWEWRVRYPSSDRMDKWEKGQDKGFDKFRTVGFEDKGQFDDLHAVNELHVVQGEKVLVWLKTRDVIHSFFLPQLRIKQDALPGKTIPLWFQVEDRDGKNYNCKLNESTGRWEDGYDPVKDKTDVGEQYWELACAEFCGSRHSMMRGKLFVHKDRADFKAWMKVAEEAFRTGAEPKEQ